MGVVEETTGRIVKELKHVFIMQADNEENVGTIS
jgi:hypothetical protein